VSTRRRSSGSRTATTTSSIRGPAFILNGIPSGGLFTGAEVVKTFEQEDIWGGEAGEQFDACHHEACDTYENNDDHALAVNSDLIAFSMLT
jgi:Zn-dependent M28 family amino/carboxypeptidase